MASPTYRPEDISLWIADYKVVGFADGSFIRLTQNAKDFTHEAGMRGKTTRVRNRDKSGVLTFSMQQTSPVNNLLSSIVDMDRDRMTGRFEVFLVDTSGDSKFLLTDCYIEGKPNIVYAANETTALEWTVNYQRVADYTAAGNTTDGAIDILASLLS